MPINKKTNFGQIKVSDDAIAVLTGTAVSECYGVVGVTSKQVIKDSFKTLLKKENYSKGVVIKKNNNVLEIDLYIICSYDVKISEVVTEVQKRVIYTLENTLNMDVTAVNVHVEGVKAV